MAENTILFKALWEMFDIEPKQKTEFLIQLGNARNFVHVRVETDDILDFGLAHFTSHQGTPEAASRPEYRLAINARHDMTGTFRLVASDGFGPYDDDDFAALGHAGDWQELGLIFTRSLDTTFFQLGVLFLQMAGTYKGKDRFSVLQPSLLAA